MHNLLSVIGMNAKRPTWSRYYSCHEYTGACPFGCGASDAFHVWNDLDDIPGIGFLGRYDCMDSSQGRNGCGKSGNMIDYIQEQENVDFDEACERLGIDAMVVRNYRREQAGKAPLERRMQKQRLRALGETDAWQTTAWAFLKNFIGLQGEPLDYLLSRGLTMETINAARLGYYPHYKRVPAHSWGYKYEDGEKPFAIKIPRGIVIPWFNAKGAVICLRFRRLPGDESEDAKAFYGVDEKTGEIGRYTVLYGSCSHLLYGIDKITPESDVALQEGELDALTAQQTEVCICVATGSTAWGRSEESLNALAMCKQVLVAYDNNPAGERAAGYWLGELNNARRWRPYMHDANAMQMAGLDVASWLRLGLEEPEKSILESAPTACCVCGTDMVIEEDLQFYYGIDGQCYCEDHWLGALPETQQRDRDNRVVPAKSWRQMTPQEQLLVVAQKIAAPWPGGMRVSEVEPRISLKEHIANQRPQQRVLANY